MGQQSALRVPEQGDVMEKIGFEELGLGEQTLSRIAELGYETATEIQARAIPALLEGSDILGISQTGTGKTAAFVLPLLERLDPTQKGLQILVLTPTRELGQQVNRAFDSYGEHLEDFRTVCLYGGQDIRLQIKDLRRHPHVVVATPGRMIDHLKRENLSLKTIQAVVLDEADEMLNMGFLEDVEEILGHVPDGIQTALFSATMPNEIERIVGDFLDDPIEVRVKQETKTVSGIDQRYILLRRNDKLEVLERIIESQPTDGGIIFVKTRSSTVEVAEHLEACGLRVAPLNGDLQQNMREATIRQLREGHIDWVVATDVAARGLDVSRITHVVNFDLPFDHEAYVHRIGRTGRAGREGMAISLLSPADMRTLRRIEGHTGAPMAPLPIPGGKEISNGRVELFRKKLLKVIGQEDLKRMKKLMGSIVEEHDLNPDEVIAALTTMATEGRPLYPKLRVIEEMKERPRGGKERREGGKGQRAQRPSPDNQQRYRISVGRDHRVGVGDIVGAFVNEGGIPGNDIGDIKLFGRFSTVDLPRNLPDHFIKDLSRIKVKNVAMGLREWKEFDKSGGGDGDDRKPAPWKNRKFEKKAGMGRKGNKPFKRNFHP